MHYLAAHTFQELFLKIKKNSAADEQHSIIIGETLSKSEKL